VLGRTVVRIGKALRIRRNVGRHRDTNGAHEVDEAVFVAHAGKAGDGHDVDHRVDEVRTGAEPKNGRDNRVAVVGISAVESLAEKAARLVQKTIVLIETDWRRARRQRDSGLRESRNAARGKRLSRTDRLAASCREPNSDQKPDEDS